MGLTADRKEKLALYKEHRFTEVWVVDREVRKVHVFCRSGRGYRERVSSKGRVESRVIPGFWVEVAWLWKRPLPPAMRCLKAIIGAKELRRWLEEA